MSACRFIRNYYLSLLILCLLGLAFAMYLQFYQNIMPCVLCIMQRVVLIGIALVAFIGWLHGCTHWGKWVYTVLLWLLSGSGVWFAGRQVWLQSLPADQVPACAPSLDYLLKALPPGELFATLFKGEGSCAQIHWQFLHLSLATWSLAFFMALFAIITIVPFLSAARP